MAMMGKAQRLSLMGHVIYGLVTAGTLYGVCRLADSSVANRPIVG
jgi:hypothetical protein